jgi:hypothetical protein
MAAAAPKPNAEEAVALTLHPPPLSLLPPDELPELELPPPSSPGAAASMDEPDDDADGIVNVALW